MTKDLADELERLAKEATPGEWQAENAGGRGSWIGNANHETSWAAMSCGNSDAEAEANAALIVALRNALPQILSALRGEAELKASVIAFAAPHAVRHADSMGLPAGTLHPGHYDLLKRCGARMDNFKRANLPKGTTHE